MVNAVKTYGTAHQNVKILSAQGKSGTDDASEIAAIQDVVTQGVKAIAITPTSPASRRCSRLRSTKESKLSKPTTINVLQALGLERLRRAGDGRPARPVDGRDVGVGGEDVLHRGKPLCLVTVGRGRVDDLGTRTECAFHAGNAHAAEGMPVPATVVRPRVGLAKDSRTPT
jgi:hypothetical protein